MSTLDGIVFILDRPQDVVNVGAVVRVLGNFGLPYLRLIEPAAFDPERILTIARRGHDVLAATRRFASLDEALQDVGFVLGTTSRERAQARPLLTPRQAAPILLAVAAMGGSPIERTNSSAPASAFGTAPALSDPHATGVGTPAERDATRVPLAPSPLGSPDAPVEQASDADPAHQNRAQTGPRLAAVLFGPENFGLSNAALDRCHAILRIPTVPHDASLNLGQAALLVAYELFLTASGDADEHATRSHVLDADAPQWMERDGASTARVGAGAPGIAGLPPEGLAVGAELEAMFIALERLLRALHPHGIPGRTAAAMGRLRALFLRATPGTADAALLTQVFEHAAREIAAR